MKVLNFSNMEELIDRKKEFIDIIHTCQIHILQQGSMTTATSKTKLFVIIVKGFHSLIIITKCSILDPSLRFAFANIHFITFISLLILSFNYFPWCLVSMGKNHFHKGYHCVFSYICIILFKIFWDLRFRSIW